MAKKSFMQGAVILGIAGLIIKVMGAFFRIPLANFIGDEGMGYYQTAYPIYVLFLTLATAGIPIAISKLVSERIAVDQHYEAYRVFRVSFILLFSIGICSSAILFFGSGAIVKAIGNPGAKFAMMAIAPALMFVPIMAAYRGYFQGMQNMKPTATSQVVEQFFRVATGLSLAYYLVGKGREYAAAGASFGATAGAITGLVAIMGLYLLHQKKLHKDIDRTSHIIGERSSKILGKIFIIAVPVTIGAAIMPIMNTIDVGIVMRRLQETGWTETAANGLYGQLTGMAAPLINFPQVLTQAIAMSLVPAIAAAYKQKDMKFLNYNVRLGLRTAILIGLPCAFGLMTLSEPIMLLLYPMQKASAVSAAPCLFIMAFGVIFLSTVQTLTGVLQGLGKPIIPVINLFIGAIVKIVLTYTLTGIDSINVKGAAIGTVAAYIVASTLNIIAVKRLIGVKFDVGLTYIKPVASALTMSAVVWFSYRMAYGFLGNAISTVIAVAIGVLVYGAMLFLTKAITNEELAYLPKGKKIVQIVNKIKR
ncbi:putative polysaccharide biosynthesis protein [Sinanaerobacter chloroacetimidivorans]|uniref:Polysaccharide biosynthesis protein n=1 Tax=Sinanaerobacter chloroacetimidivorans TaxID=2818044 RepID=A0A8J7W7A9_9FIRM|nr:polysaccharide biosynthesis protein [Sinanaerobacter chloroacetimidivorans]MBR0600435.1 polysaccharide biosynthesis protein [Sinanaerobacter chloroacetimidivorans]